MIEALVCVALIPAWLAAAGGAAMWWGFHYITGGFR